MSTTTMVNIEHSLLPLLKNALYAVADRLIFFTDPLGTILFFNEVAQQRLGYDLSGADSGMNVSQFHLASELQLQADCLKNEWNLPVRPDFEVVYTRAQKQKYSQGKNWTYRCKDGSTFPIELLVTAARDDDQHLGGFLIVARDVTEQVERNEALSDSEERYRSVVHVMEEGIILQDADGTVTACNASAEAMTGLTLDQMNDPFSGTLLWDAIGIDGFPFPAAEYPLTVSLRTGQPCSRVVMGLRKANGNLTWLSINSRPLFRTGITKPHAVMISLTDITERRRIEAELARARDIAVNAAQMKSSFLANASHEIRTPLNAVIGIVDILLDTDLSERQREYVKTLDKSAESLLVLINDLLDLSKIEAGKNIVDESLIDVPDIATSTVEQLMAQAQAKGINLTTVVAPDVRPQLCGDSTRLRQILLNLLFNALKFTEKGEVTLKLHQQEETEFASVLCFEVHDTGPGITRDAREHIFEPFWQDNNQQHRQYASTGLGLAICKQLVDMMGGNIWVESIIGKGSTFCFTVPLRKVKNEVVPEIQAALPIASVVEPDQKSEPAVNEQPFKDIRVLLVEDNEVNQQVILYKLQSCGCLTDIVDDGLKAVKAAEEKTYDIVLMDCQLPFMDGYEATRKIRQRETLLNTSSIQTAPAYIIALTANAMHGDREKCLAAGMDDYLSKPVRFPALITAFERWDSKRKNEPEALEVEDDTPIPEPVPVVEDVPVTAPASFDVNNQDLIDTESLNNLSSSMSGDTLLAELIDLFLKDSVKYLKAIHQTVEENDPRGAARQAHALGGSCSHFGAAQLREVCSQLEECGRANDIGLARELLPKLDTQFFALHHELEGLKEALMNKARK